MLFDFFLTVSEKRILENFTILYLPDQISLLKAKKKLFKFFWISIRGVSQKLECLQEAGGIPVCRHRKLPTQV